MSDLHKNIGIIIQARLGSTRLPGKMLLPFYKEHSLAEIVFSKLSVLNNKYKVILATSAKEENNALIELANKYFLHNHRGSEDDVLGRFIDAAERYKLDIVVRVCADNPFLSIKYLELLLDRYRDEPCDYMSFSFPDGTPTIKSHIGLFAEVVSLTALKKVKQLSSEKVFLEHVTNYVYTHKELFSVKLIPLPDYIAQKRNVRLTVDSANDFLLTKEIFEKVCNASDIKEDIELHGLLSTTENNPNYLSLMQQEIKKNEK